MYPSSDVERDLALATATSSRRVQHTELDAAGMSATQEKLVGKGGWLVGLVHVLPASRRHKLNNAGVPNRDEMAGIDGMVRAAMTKEREDKNPV